MSGKEEAMRFLEAEIGKRAKMTVLNFSEYLERVRRSPTMHLRNIFRIFYDMAKSLVSEGVDEYPDDPESIGFKQYDCSALLEESAENPFFADRLFANRFIRQVESLRQGFQQNRIYVYEGPSGCGKSTFLNNLLRTFEIYTRTEEGQTFEIVWEIAEALFWGGTENRQKLIVPCPSHDHPILAIPKEHRAKLLDKLLSDAPEARKRIFNDKDYEWLFRREACTICKSIFWASFERLSSAEKVFQFVTARTRRFDRRTGEGISVFNPGDRPFWFVADGKAAGECFTNQHIQEGLDRLFGAGSVKFVYSPLARTNDGIYVLMDIKGHNKERLLELHNVISEGVRRVGETEEQINSFFFALMNPEDKRVIEEEKMESFKGRIQYNKIPYVLEPATEVKIYLRVFGEQIRERFLPMVLENFARVIISSRMSRECVPLKEWIPDPRKYELYCDADGLLLRMEVYSGVIPVWLSEEDRKNFTAPKRKALIAEGEKEGDKGFSGRDSIGLFNEFLSRYGARTVLVNMDNVVDFFKDHIGKDRRDENVPKKFLVSLMNSYDYAVLNRVKEAMYFYNEEQIRKDVLHYLCAVNHDVGGRIRCPYTGEMIEGTIEFLMMIAGHILGKEVAKQEALKLAQETQKKYIVVVSRERGDICKTELYRDLFGAYVRNLKERALQPFVGNDNFREAVKSYGKEGFGAFDGRLRERVAYMIKNLINKFGYTEQGAKEICLYVLDKKLCDKFPS